MTETTRHDGTPTPAPGDLPLAALVRLAADGEISAEQERRLEIELERDPDLARRIEAERMLRLAVARTLGSEDRAAPAGLRERVAGAMAEVDLTDGGSGDGPAVPTRMAPATRDRSFWAGPGARVLAAVAALTLVATVFVVTRGSADDSTLGTRTRAVQFVATEHGRCITDIAEGADKFVITDADAMPGFTGGVLGSEITVGDLLAGGVRNVSFVDAGQCHVPGGGGSLHLRFEVPAAGAETETQTERFSLFVQHDTGRLGLDEGVSYELDPSGGGEIDLKSPAVYVWLRDGLVYYLVVDNAKACPEIRERLSAPDEIEPLTNAA